MGGSRMPYRLALLAACPYAWWGIDYIMLHFFSQASWPNMCAILCYALIATLVILPSTIKALVVLIVACGPVYQWFDILGDNFLIRVCRWLLCVGIVVTGILSLGPFWFFYAYLENCIVIPKDDDC